MELSVSMMLMINVMTAAVNFVTLEPLIILHNSKKSPEYELWGRINLNRLSIKTELRLYELQFFKLSKPVLDTNYINIQQSKKKGAIVSLPAREMSLSLGGIWLNLLNMA